MILAITTIEVFASAETLLVSMPESVGVLVFGIALVMLAVAIRNFMAKSASEKTEEKIVKKA